MLGYSSGELVLVSWRSTHKPICLEWLLRAQALHEVRVTVPLMLEEVVNNLLCQQVHVDATGEVGRISGAQIVW